MMDGWVDRWLKMNCLGLLGLTSLLLIRAEVSLAQVIPDGSLGSENSVVNATTLPNTLLLISGGAERSRQLFHSFQTFNVAPSQQVLFSPSGNISNIFARVTGGNASTILGTLGVVGPANLFLLNPQGILFGPNAQLALGGSFVATTADGFLFGAQTFSAISPQAAPMLTVTVPIGLGFGANPGAIVNRSTANGVGLGVTPFHTLGLLGGDVAIEGGRITVGSGRIELGSFKTDTVRLNPNPSGFALESAGGGGTIQLSNQAQVVNESVLDNPNAALNLLGGLVKLEGQSNILTLNRSDFPGIDLAVDADQLRLVEGSHILSRASGSGPNGELRINVKGLLEIDGGRFSTVLDHSSIVSSVEGLGGGKPLSIQTGQLLLDNGGRVFTLSTGSGRSGPLEIQADAIVAQSPAPLLPVLRSGIVAFSYGPGGSNDIRVKSRTLRVEGGASIEAVVLGDGQASNIQVDVTDQIILRGQDPQFPDLESKISNGGFGRQDGGYIKLTTRNLLIDQGASIITVATKLGSSLDPLFLPKTSKDFEFTPVGKAGNIDITADSIIVQGAGKSDITGVSQIVSATLLESDAGNLDIKTGQLQIRDGGLVVSSSLVAVLRKTSLRSPQNERGNGGNVTVNAEDILVEGINQNGLPSILGTQAFSSGKAGNTTINTQRLAVLSGGLVSSGISSSGNAGSLEINASKGILVQGRQFDQTSAIGTFAIPQSPAVREKLSISDNPFPTGRTGNLSITTPNLEIRDGGFVGGQHFGVGDAGNVDLRVSGSLLLRNGGKINLSAQQGNGGNLTINAGVILAVPKENSDIIANAPNGDGGRIIINASGLLGIEFRNQLTTESDINASAGEQGIDGTVQINPLRFDPVQGAAELPTVPLSSDRQIITTCDRPGNSRFVVSGRGGLSNDPRQQLQSPAAIQDWRSVPELEAPLPQEATDVVIDDHGRPRLWARGNHRPIQCGGGGK
jgi:filamentous hemagglutinin family protein